MKANTKRALLDRLRQGDAMQGWGAMLALGRGPANQLLEASYLKALRTQDMFLPISGQYYSDSRRTEQVVFDALVFGPPQLTFKHATGGTPNVTVQFELIAGRCRTCAIHPGRAKRLRTSHVLQQGMGLTLEVSAKLAVRMVPGSKQMQVVLDFDADSIATCTLGSTTSTANAMGEFLWGNLHAQPQFVHSLTLCTLDSIGYDALAVVDGLPITIAAPVPEGQARSDDGAVVLLLQLTGQVDQGDIPKDLPYLLPETDSDDGGNHGAALLVSRLRSGFIGVRGKELLKSLILPEGHGVIFDDDHTPFDRILFGELGTGDQTNRIDPGLSCVAAGASLQLSAIGQPSTTWDVRNVRYPTAKGSITSEGSYTATPVENFPAEQNVVVATGSTTFENRTYVRSALVVESEYPLAISPRVAPWSRGDDPITLTASRAGKWELMGDKHGELVPDSADGRRATFIPADVTGQAVRLQRIRVADGDEHGFATIAMTNPSMVQIEPFHVSNLASGTQQFRLIDAEADLWEVYGAGTIDENTGLYTAPTDNAGAGEVSVVRAISGRSGGYALIEHQRNAASRMMMKQERWQSLAKFTLEPNSPSRTKVLANGRQQVGIDITIVTNSFVNGDKETVFDPVSDLELSTLVLLGPDGEEFEYLPPGQESLQPGGKLWAASKQRNRFDYLPTSAASPAVEASHAPDDGKRVVTIYVQTLSGEPMTFTAKFQDHKNKWHHSDSLPSLKDGEIKIEVVDVPVPSLENYTFGEAGQGLRVAAQQGQDVKDSTGRVDTFNYWHHTTDYWELVGRGITFVDVQFDSNSSMIKWESEQKNETFVSYTGYAFNPRRPEDASFLQEGVQYHGLLQLLTGEDSVKYDRLDYAFKKQYRVPKGVLLFTLDRTSEFPFWNPSAGNYRPILDEALSFTLIDNYGTTHSLSVSFDYGTDERNGLRLALGAGRMEVSA